MTDRLVRSIAKEAGVRAVLAITTVAAAEAARRHQSTPTATSALGNALTAGALAGTLLKVKQRVALKFQGDGPLEKIMAESDAYGRVRAYVQQPKVEVERDDNGNIDVATALGSGVLHVSKDVGRGQLIEGVVEMVSGQIDSDFSAYLNQSEQIPSAVQIHTILDAEGNIAAAGGIMLQSFGDEGKTQFATLSERLEELPPIVELLHAGKSSDEILTLVFGDTEYDVLEERELEFNCTCSYDRSEKAVRMLGREDIEGLIEEGEAVVSCHFCHEQYLFTTDELQVMLLTL